MTEILQLPTHTDHRGSLTVLERVLPFTIKRIYYIYQTRGIRGGHAHKKTQQALICVAGQCEIVIKNTNDQIVILDSPDKCLLLDPSDWHTMQNFSEDAVLLVAASHEYDREDYIFNEPLSCK